MWLTNMCLLIKIISTESALPINVPFFSTESVKGRQQCVQTSLKGIYREKRLFPQLLSTCVHDREKDNLRV